MGIWEYGNMGIWGYGDMGMWGCGDVGMWGCNSILETVSHFVSETPFTCNDSNLKPET